MSESRIEYPRTVEDAVTALEDPGTVALAGGTWIMRGPIRGEPWAETYVALGGIAELQETQSGPLTRFGACVTHAELAQATVGQAWLAGLHRAASTSANPAVRRVATLGGNVCAGGFAAADLIPALLALDAEVVLRMGHIERELKLTEFLADRSSVGAPGFVTAVILRQRDSVGGHARLPLRVAGGDYAVAIVSIVVSCDSRGRIERAAVAVGSVEPVARRWPELEDALVGQPIDPDSAAGTAEALTDGWSGREDVDAPGWYRVRVLPALVRRAMGEVLTARERAR